jgi:hypothetical protein
MVTRVLRGATGMLWGTAPSLIGEIVDRLGALRSLGWFASNLPRYELTLRKWSPARTHLLCVEASLLNSCAYCAHAHALSFQLHYFKNSGSLFPLDEHAMIALRDGSDSELRAALKGALEKAKMSEDCSLFDELWNIKFAGKKPSTDEERRVGHILSMFDMLNYCGIDSQRPFDHAHDPINKDAELKKLYAEARLQQANP